jgi:hypothetical protein
MRTDFEGNAAGGRRKNRKIRERERERERERDERMKTNWSKNNGANLGNSSPPHAVHAVLAAAAAGRIESNYPPRV